MNFDLGIGQNFLQNFLKLPQTYFCHLQYRCMQSSILSINDYKIKCQSTLQNIDECPAISNIQPQLNSLCKKNHIHIISMQMYLY